MPSRFLWNFSTVPSWRANGLESRLQAVATTDQLCRVNAELQTGRFVQPMAGRLSVGGFFIRGRAGTPVASLPDIDVALLHPFAPKPDVARMRTRPPVAGHPDPLAAPGPMSGNEIPQRPRAGTRGNDIVLIVRRRLCGLADMDVVRRRDLRPDIGWP